MIVLLKTKMNNYNLYICGDQSMNVASMKKFLILYITLLFTFDVSKAQDYVDNDLLLNELEQVSSADEKAVIYLEMASNSTNINLFQSIEYIEDALDLQASLEDRSLLARIYLKGGDVFNSLGRFNEAQGYYYNALKLYEKLKKPKGIADVHNNIGIMYFHNSNLEKALEHYLESLRILRDHIKVYPEDKDTFANVTLNNIASIYLHQGKTDKALEYYNIYLDECNKLNDINGKAPLFLNMGLLYNHMNEPAKAYDAFMKSLKICESTGNKSGIIRPLTKLGEYFKNNNQFEKAIPYLLKAKQMGLEIGEPKWVMIATRYLVEIYIEQDNYKEAYSNQLLNRQLSDSAFNEENVKRMAQLEMQYEFDKKQEIREVERRKTESYFIMGGGMLFFLFIISLLLFFLQKNKSNSLKREKKTLKELIDLKNKELAAKVVHQVKNNELIHDISKRLKIFRSELNDKQQQALQSLITDLQINLDDNVWDKFEVSFTQVHENFFKNLNKEFPNLTLNEKKLCAFLRLDMTTKEISSITKQTPNSIVVARTRLRNKLGLVNKDTSLHGFLSKY